MNERVLPPEKEAILRDAIQAKFGQGERLGWDWQLIAEAELSSRLREFRARYQPWLSSVVPLKGARVLEVGTGTGCASIPILEAGATVTGVDLSSRDLEVATLRAELHAVADRASFVCLNADEIGKEFRRGSFDLIIYSASLEHMTWQERRATLAAAWSMLTPGQYLGVCETPNRLWYFDEHTAFANFFHWLPDDIAIDYARRTPRERFNTHFLQPGADDHLTLTRYGRGVSYHDFELAWDIDISTLQPNGEWEYRRTNITPEWWRDTWMNSKDGRYFQFLRSIAPNLPIAFVEPELAFVVRKP